jgi:hypothetical protein
MLGVKMRQHYFFNIKLVSQGSDCGHVEVIQWRRRPLGLIIHCLFWLHSPHNIQTEDVGMKWTCRECLLKEHSKLKAEN